MTLLRPCYLCGKPVGVRRHMSLFCSQRCELRHRHLSAAPQSPLRPRPPADNAAVQHSVTPRPVAPGPGPSSRRAPTPERPPL